MIQLIKKVIRKYGRDLIAIDPSHERDFSSFTDLAQHERNILVSSSPFTMTSPERMVALIESVKYVVSNEIAGDVVECGVWRGGSMMVIASTLLELGDSSRTLYLYDTFEGMPPPGENDIDHSGIDAETLLNNTPKGEGVWCEASIEDVRNNLLSTGYPADKIRFIKGKVEDTIPATLPTQISLLRLDTDWYESTKHELTHLFPLLSRSGFLIIDDYGYWQGARKAVDEYFSGKKVYLHRIDNTGRLLHREAQ